MITVNDWAQIALAAFRLILMVLAVVIGGMLIPWMKKEGIPWLKERRLYNLVYWFVNAAEKMYQYDEDAGREKFNFVVERLEEKGVEVTEEVRGYIEAAVNELDMFAAEAFGNVDELFEPEDEETEYPEANTENTEEAE